MTIGQLKKGLNKPYWLRKEMTTNEKLIKTLKESMYRLQEIKYGDKIQVGCIDSKIENDVIKVTLLTEKLLKQNQEYIRIVEEVESIINKVEDDRERLVLKLRHLHCMKWEDIAKEMNYSVDHIFKVYAKSLKSLLKFFEHNSN